MMMLLMLPTKATTEAVEIPGLCFIFLLLLFLLIMRSLTKATIEAVEIAGLRYGLLAKS